jgi:hypothetical protein
LFQGLSSPEETRFRTKFGMTSYFWDMKIEHSAQKIRFEEDIWKKKTETETSLILLMT